MKHVYNLNIKRIPVTELKIRKFEKITLPTSVDLRSKMPPVYDQGQLGSCTANGLAACFEYDEKSKIMPSRLFIYYNERSIEGTIKTDSGANISDGIKSLLTNGVCAESMWPYNISKFTTKPPTACYTAASECKAITVHNIQQDITSIKTCLASGFPIVLGISVYESFESQEVANTGIVPMPKSNEQCLGGHCVCVVGYNDTTKTWLMRNSWGTGWGLSGYFTLPYAYLINSNLCSDLWNITGLKIITPAPAKGQTTLNKKL